jgi:hypothetical protein
MPLTQALGSKLSLFKDFCTKAWALTQPYF